MDRLQILQFDLDEENLAFIDAPSDDFDLDMCQFGMTPADGGGLNFISLKGFTVHVWKRMLNGNGVSRWMLGNTFELSNLLSLRPSGYDGTVLILTLDEDSNMMFTLKDDGVTFMLHLRTMLFKKLTKKMSIRRYHPFISFYNAGTGFPIANM